MSLMRRILVVLVANLGLAAGSRRSARSCPQCKGESKQRVCSTCFGSGTIVPFKRRKFCLTCAGFKGRECTATKSCQGRGWVSKSVKRRGKPHRAGQRHSQKARLSQRPSTVTPRSSRTLPRSGSTTRQTRSAVPSAKFGSNDCRFRIANAKPDKCIHCVYKRGDKVSHPGTYLGLGKGCCDECLGSETTVRRADVNPCSSCGGVGKARGCSTVCSKCDGEGWELIQYLDVDRRRRLTARLAKHEARGY